MPQSVIVHDASGSVSAAATFAWPQGRTAMVAVVALVVGLALHWVCAAVTVVLWLGFVLVVWQRGVTVLCVEHNGMVREQHGMLRTVSEFFPIDTIDDVVINECMHGLRVIMVLQLLVKADPQRIVLLLSDAPLAQLTVVRARMRQLLRLPSR